MLNTVSSMAHGRGSKPLTSGAWSTALTLPGHTCGGMHTFSDKSQPCCGGGSHPFAQFQCTTVFARMYHTATSYAGGRRCAGGACAPCTRQDSSMADPAAVSGCLYSCCAFPGQDGVLLVKFRRCSLHPEGAPLTSAAVSRLLGVHRGTPSSLETAARVNCT